MPNLEEKYIQNDKRARWLHVVAGLLNASQPVTIVSQSGERAQKLADEAREWAESVRPRREARHAPAPTGIPDPE